jgi:uncharacterized membrane protein
MTKNWQWIAAVGLLVLTCACSLLLYPRLPAVIPTHWNIKGEIDGYGSKQWAVFMMPIAMAVMMVLFRFLPALSPKHFEVDSFRSTYLWIMVLVIAMFAYIHGLMLYSVWAHVEKAGFKFDFGRVMLGGMFIFFGLLGNVMGKIKRNFYMGVRVPWTLASDRVWNDTHRLAAWLMVAGSIVGFLITVSGLSLIAAMVVLFVSVLTPIPYSFVHYKRLERQGAL